MNLLAIYRNEHYTEVLESNTDARLNSSCVRFFCGDYQSFVTNGFQSYANRLLRKLRETKDYIM